MFGSNCRNVVWLPIVLRAIHLAGCARDATRRNARSARERVSALPARTARRAHKASARVTFCVCSPHSHSSSLVMSSSSSGEPSNCTAAAEREERRRGAARGRGEQGSEALGSQRDARAPIGRREGGASLPLARAALRARCAHRSLRRPYPHGEPVLLERVDGARVGHVHLAARRRLLIPITIAGAPFYVKKMSGTGASSAG